jgi:hypothetical protein
MKAVKKTISKKPSSSELTQEALEVHDQQQLERYTMGEITGDQCFDSMSQVGSNRLWKKFDYARKNNQEANNGWSELCVAGGRGQLQAKKRQLLMAWVMDPKFGQHYMSVQSSVVVSREQTKKLKWLTFEQLKNKHGMAEASAMIRARTIIMRRNPMDKRFWQFLSPEDSQAMRMKVSKKVEGTQSGKATQAEFTSFEQSMGELELDEDLFNDLMEKNSADAMVVGKNMKTNKVATQEENEDDDGLPDELKALMPTVPAKKAPKGSAKNRRNLRRRKFPRSATLTRRWMS